MSQVSDHSATPGDAVTLRRGMADIVGLASLPAAWAGASRASVARDLADVLHRILPGTIVLVTLTPSGAEPAVHTSSTDGSVHAIETRDRVAASLADWAASPRSRSSPPLLPVTPDPLTMTPIGINSELGVLVVGWSLAEYPTDLNRVVLNIAANVAAYAVQARQVDG